MPTNALEGSGENRAHKIDYRIYKFFSLSMAITFAIVGLVFLFMANGVLAFFNDLSLRLGMAVSPEAGVDFYLILAVGYMYLVTLLAFFMYRHPQNSFFPLLLLNGKAASSLLSIAMFLLHRPFLIYLANGIVDGLIAVAVLVFYRELKAIGA
jgi:hypothetical protein